MKVFIKNKLISIGGSSEVYNENQEVIYNVKGKVFSPTKKKLMYDSNGNLLYVIRNKYWTFIYDSVFVYDANGNKVATIKKGKWSIKPVYKIIDSVDSLEIKGKFFSRHAQILRNEQVVANMSKEFTIINDAFTLEAEEKDIPFFTALVIAFDNFRDNRNKDRD